MAFIAFLLLCTQTAFADVSVRGYVRKDGTYVSPHMRSNPDGNFWNNWSTKGNINPYTGKPGTKTWPTYTPPKYVPYVPPMTPSTFTPLKPPAGGCKTITIPAKVIPKKVIPKKVIPAKVINGVYYPEVVLPEVVLPEVVVPAYTLTTCN